MSLLSEYVLNLIKKIASEECLTNCEIISEPRKFTGDNFLGDIVKVKVQGECCGDKKNIFLIVKKSSDNSDARNCMNVVEYYRSEVFIYKNVLPAFEALQNKYGLPEQERFHYPKYYEASLEECKEFVILGDLSYDGYSTTSERRKPLDYNHMKLVIESLARLHATSFVMKEENITLYEVLVEGIIHTENYGDLIAEITEKCIKKIIPKLRMDVNRRKLEKFIGKARKTYEECLDATKTHPYNVICHGDSFINNLLFKYDNDSNVTDLILVDWQMARYASPATDLTYAISLSTDQETRNKYLSTLLDFYYETLGKNIAMMGHSVQTCYPRNIFEQHVKEVFRFGLVFSMMSITYLLKKPGEEKKIEDISNQLKDEELDVEIHEGVVERVEGLLSDFIKLEYI